MTGLDDPDPTKPIDPDLDYPARAEGKPRRDRRLFHLDDELGSTATARRLIVKVPKTTLLRGRP